MSEEDISKIEKEKIKPLHIKSIKLNFVLNTTRMILTFLVPLITFPYVSRVLLPEGIGKVDFANSIISYFILFTALGIPTYGIREIARVRDNVEERSKTVWELTIVLVVSVLIGYLVYIPTIYFVPQFKTELLLFFIVSPTLFLSDFSYEWFFQGIEDQTYITIRFLIIKILQVISIFFFVRDSTDYPVYAAASVGFSSLSTVFNIIYLKKYVRFIPFKSLNIKRHLKSVFIIFSSVVATTIYMHLDVTMTGFISGDRSTGLYTTANKLIRIIISGVTALGAVMIPRIENFLKTGNKEEYYRLLNISLGYILLVSIPCCLGVNALANDIITIFAGKNYYDAVITIQLLSPIIIIVGLAYFVGLQILYPYRKEWQYTIAVSIAAVLNIIANSIFIPKFAQNGAVIGTLIAELSGLIIQCFFARKYLKKTDLISSNSLKYIIASVIMFLVIKFIPNFEKNLILHCVSRIFIGSFVYLLILFLLKEKIISNFFNKLKREKRA